MDARFLGFQIDFQSSNISFSNLFEELARTPITINGDDETKNNRILYINTDYHNDFFIGMIITVRDQKKFCKGKVKQGEFTFDIVDLKKEDKILEFNYFVINKHSGLGLYQHYHQSCSPRILGKILKEQSARYWYSCADAEIACEQAKVSGELKESHRRKIYNKYRVKINFSILVRKENLEILLQEYAKIKSFEFEYAILTPDIQKATPLAQHVLKKREILRFHTPTDVIGLAASIANFTINNDLNSGRIKVENDLGDEIPLRIFNMPDYFAVYDFDALVDKLYNIRSSEFYKSEIVTLLIENYTSDEYSHIFQMKVKSEN